MFALHLIWKLFTLSGSLWVAWTRAHLLRGVSFRDVKAACKGSWIWKKLMKLRSTAAEFLHMEIKNGEGAYFWSDHWTKHGKLIDLMGETVTTQLGVRRHARVSEVSVDGAWEIRRCRNPHLRQVVDQIIELSPPDPTDGHDVCM